MVARAVRLGSALAAMGVAAAVVGAAVAREPSGDSGIRGRVVACGIVHERAWCPRDVGGTKVRIRRAADGRWITTARTDQDGRFRVGLGPGAYLIEVASPLSAARPARTVRFRVAVRTHAWTTVTLPSARLAPPARAVSGR